MSEAVIKVRGLGKRYRLGGTRKRYKTIRESFTETITAPFRRSAQATADSAADNTFWALKDVSFDVQPGEVVGIIGRNGAGKSTLLKVLSRITDPTEGEVEITGRVGSLLEVGTGFHPELTGRENIYLNGAILGMTRAEVSRKFDEIVAFAETEKFLDTPVKFYSSGMYTRLAFAVAAHLEPEILVVDEVLAVGDAEFQKKCLGRMSEVARHGRTVLFVSHNMTAVNQLCQRAVWLKGGAVVRSGSTARVVEDYLRSGDQIESERIWEVTSEAPGNDQVRLRRVCVEGDRRDGIISLDSTITLTFEYWNNLSDVELNVSTFVYNGEGLMVFNLPSPPQHEAAGLVRCSYEIPGGFLNDGLHRVRVMVVRDQANVLLDVDDVVQFNVQELSRTLAWHGKWPGATRPQFKWRVATQTEGEFARSAS